MILNKNDIDCKVLNLVKHYNLNLKSTLIHLRLKKKSYKILLSSCFSRMINIVNHKSTTFENEF